jgi:hypothetical protein
MRTCDLQKLAVAGGDLSPWAYRTSNSYAVMLAGGRVMLRGISVNELRFMRSPPDFPVAMVLAGPLPLASFAIPAVMATRRGRAAEGDQGPVRP